MNKLMFTGLLAVVLLLGYGLYVGQVGNLNAGTLSMEEMGKITAGASGGGSCCSGTASCGGPKCTLVGFTCHCGDNPDCHCVGFDIAMLVEGNGLSYPVCTSAYSGTCSNSRSYQCGFVTYYLTWCGKAVYKERAPYYVKACR
jgi:hypothetical protein